MGKYRQKDKQELENLSHGEECTVSWFEEGGGAVHRLWDVYVLFRVPQYGGEPRYEGTFLEDQIDELLDVAYSWT